MFKLSLTRVYNITRTARCPCIRLYTVFPLANDVYPSRVQKLTRTTRHWWHLEVVLTLRTSNVTLAPPQHCSYRLDCALAGTYGKEGGCPVAAAGPDRGIHTACRRTDERDDHASGSGQGKQRRRFPKHDHCCECSIPMEMDRFSIHMSAVVAISDPFHGVSRSLRSIPPLQIKAQLVEARGQAPLYVVSLRSCITYN